MSNPFLGCSAVDRPDNRLELATIVPSAMLSALLRTSRDPEAGDHQNE
jgi:hypothetical protein